VSNQSEIFAELLNKTPKETKLFVRISFDIADQILTFLREEGIDQKEFAKRLKKKESEVSRWLSGTHNFTVRTLAKIENVLGREVVLVPKFANKILIQQIVFYSSQAAINYNYVVDKKQIKSQSSPNRISNLTLNASSQSGSSSIALQNSQV
jgi:transcriptional regulator with XRE-family HTH domain